MQLKGYLREHSIGNHKQDANKEPEKEFEDDTDPDNFRNFKIDPETGLPDPENPKTGVEAE